MGTILKKADEYRFTCKVRATAHFKLAQSYSQRHIYFGVPVVVLSAVAATTIFASLSKSPDHTTIIVVGGISIAAAVLSALQTFLRFSDLSTEHHRSAIAYEALWRTIDLFELKYDSAPQPGDAQEALEKITEQLNQTVAAAPTIPYAFYKETERPGTHTAPA